MTSSEKKKANVQGSRRAKKLPNASVTLPTRSSTHQSSEVKQDILSLSKAGTMQLRKIARSIQIKNAYKLPRQELIFAIIAQKEKFLQGQQMELFR